MIKKERLEELIEQIADIFVVMSFGVYTHKLTREYKFGDYGVGVVKYGKVSERWAYEDLFETKEDAEEYAEFGNITRTERLELPNWEEFNKVSTFTFRRKDGTDMEIAIWHNCPDDDCKTIKITLSYDWTACCFEKPLTRENYNDARRLCIKLFKGEC